MIELTRLNGDMFYMNPDQILSLESTPDTVVTLLNGEKLMVRDKLETVTERFMAYQHAIRQPARLN